MVVVINPTLMITNNADFTMVLINSFWLFFNVASKSSIAAFLSISRAFLSFSELFNSICKLSVSSLISFLFLIASVTSIAILIMLVTFPLLSNTGL
jgi:hypothetical protein